MRLSYSAVLVIWSSFTHVFGTYSTTHADKLYTNLRQSGRGVHGGTPLDSSLCYTQHLFANVAAVPHTGALAVTTIDPQKEKTPEYKHGAKYNYSTGERRCVLA